MHRAPLWMTFCSAGELAAYAVIGLWHPQSEHGSISAARRRILHTINGRHWVTMSLGILCKNATIKTLDCPRTASCDASKCAYMRWLLAEVIFPRTFHPFPRILPTLYRILCLARCHFDVHATIYGAVNNMATCFLLACVWTC